MARRPDRGEVAHYIPELARVDPGQFGMAVIGADGEVAVGGHADVPFSIQSISKVFTLTLALGMIGDRLWRRVGREPSGNPFNSIVQLEHESGVPRNPFINAGAIAVTDVIVSGHQPRESLGEILRFMQSLAKDPGITIDASVAASEKRTGFRNTALAKLHEVLRRHREPGRFHARRLLPPLRHRHDVPATRHGRPVPGPFRPRSSDRPFRGLGRAGAAHQCPDADLRPLRRIGRVRLSRRTTGQERRRGRHPGGGTGRGLPSRSGRRVSTTPAIPTSAGSPWRSWRSAWAGPSSVNDGQCACSLSTSDHLKAAAGSMRRAPGRHAAWHRRCLASAAQKRSIALAGCLSRRRAPPMRGMQ